MNIYVGNLNYKVRESDLQKVMEDYGAVTAVKFIKDRETGRFRGIAFVCNGNYTETIRAAFL